MFKKESLENAAALVTIVGFPILAVSMVLAFYQLRDLKRVASSQNNIALNALFFSSDNIGIIDAFENKKPILVENKGKYTDAQLDNYLGDFDTIDISYQEGFLTEKELCNSFSYYITETPKNKEIQRYITSQQKQNSGFFTSIATLNSVISKSKDPDCH